MMILAFIIEVLFVFVIMKFMASLGFINCCFLYGLFSVICAMLGGFGISQIVVAFLGGLLSGALAFLAAKFFLFLIEIMGSIAYVLIIALVVLVIIGAIISIF